MFPWLQEPKSFCLRSVTSTTLPLAFSASLGTSAHSPRQCTPTPGRNACKFRRELRLSDSQTVTGGGGGGDSSTVGDNRSSGDWTCPREHCSLKVVLVAIAVAGLTRGRAARAVGTKKGGKACGEGAASKQNISTKTVALWSWLETREHLYVSAPRTSSSCLLSRTPSSRRLVVVGSEPRGHWVLRSHCERLVFPSPHAGLALPTRHGRLQWHLRAVSGWHGAGYQGQVAAALLTTVRAWTALGTRLSRLVLDDLLVKAGHLEPASRSALFGGLEQVLRCHSGLTAVSLENCRLDRGEGTRLLRALAVSSAHTLQQLHLQGAFAVGQNPLLEDSTPEPFRGVPTASAGAPAFRSKTACRGDYERALSAFSALRFLALDHGQLSSEVLVWLVSRQPASLCFLQLLCLERELESPAVPDGVWRLAAALRPQLSVCIVIEGVAEDKRTQWFLSPSMPLSHFSVSSGLQAWRRAPWDFHVTLRRLAHTHGHQLESIYIHLHRSREDLDSMLAEMFDMFPRLESLEFTGLIRDTRTIEGVCSMLATTPRCARHLRIRAQESSTGDRQRVRETIASLQEEYQERLEQVGVVLDLATYRA